VALKQGSRKGKGRGKRAGSVLSHVGGEEGEGGEGIRTTFTQQSEKSLLPENGKKKEGKTTKSFTGNKKKGGKRGKKSFKVLPFHFSGALRDRGGGKKDRGSLVYTYAKRKRRGKERDWGPPSSRSGRGERKGVKKADEGREGKGGPARPYFPFTLLDQKREGRKL